MNWEKKGLIFDQTNYASVPTVIKITGNLYRVFFADRDDLNRSRLRSFDMDLSDIDNIKISGHKLIMKPGYVGNFDDSGVMPSCILIQGSELWLYYIGWNITQTVPFRNSIGLAISKDMGKSFERFSDGPIVDRSIYDPAFVASSYVIKEKNKYRMWYLSCIKWEKLEDGFEHKYHIKYAESNDGISWSREGLVCIDFKDKREYAISRPTILKESGTYRMWYSYRGTSYKIGYAESNDGYTWTRKDNEVGIHVSHSGWDSEMIEYPYVFEHNNKKIMVYNGNGYGKTGIGLAVLNE